jgi:hypothetical protein
MSQDSRPVRFGLDPEESTVRRIVGALVGLAGLLFVVGLVAVLPAVDRLLSALAVSPMALLVGVTTLLVVGVLVIVAPAVGALVEQSLDGPDAVVEGAAASAMYLVGFAGVVIAYRGFAGVLTPLFRAFGIGGLYHLGFLVVGLVVLGALVRQLYRCWAPVTELLTASVTGAFGGERTTHLHE